jgi:hypothetical protein
MAPTGVKAQSDVEGAPMKALAFAFVLVALLALPGLAAAKGPTKATICGPESCKSLGTDHRVAGLAHGYGGAMSEMPAPAPYYELLIPSVGGEGDWTTWYVPSAKMFARLVDGEGVYWMPLDKPELAWAAKDIEPFAVPEITAVTIGSRRVTDDPASYLRLLTVETTDRNANPHGLEDWEPVTFVSKQRSPWTLGQSGLQFSSSRGVLQRGIDLVKLPDEMAADLRGGRPLADESAFPWQNVLLAVLGAAALLAAVGSVRPLRRRIIVRRAPTTA